MAARNQTLGNRRANRRLRQASATLRSNRQVRRSRRTLLRVVARRRPLQVALATLAVITRNETQQLIAGVAYYAMVALAPVTAGMLQIFGLLLGAERAQQLFAHVTAELLPVDINVGALVAPQDSTQAGVTGLVILAWLAWGSFRLFAAIALVINYVWDITPAQVGFVGKFREFLLLSAVSLALLVSTLLTNIIAHAVVPSVMAELGMMAGARALDEQHWWSFALAWPLSALAFLLVVPLSAGAPGALAVGNSGSAAGHRGVQSDERRVLLLSGERGAFISAVLAAGHWVDFSDLDFPVVTDHNGWRNGYGIYAEHLRV